MATVTHFLRPESAHFDPDLAEPQYRTQNGTNMSVVTLNFDATTKEQCFFVLRATRYGSGNLTLRFLWGGRTASTGDVIWGASLAATTPNTDATPLSSKTFATEQTVTDSHLGTNNERIHEATLTLSNLDSIVAGDYLVLKVTRDAANASDTMAGDAILFGVVVEWSDV